MFSAVKDIKLTEAEREQMQKELEERRREQEGKGENAVNQLPITNNVITEIPEDESPDNSFAKVSYLSMAEHEIGTLAPTTTPARVSQNDVRSLK